MSYEAWGDDDDGLDGAREHMVKQMMEDGWLDDVIAERVRALVEKWRHDQNVPSDEISPAFVQGWDLARECCADELAAALRGSP